MYRIRFHGRGGQGLKTASRILGSALFYEGWDVQDAPRYGAERRGAPIAAYVRAARQPIHERGAIAVPDLVVVADESLLHLPGAAGALEGLSAGAVVLVYGGDPSAPWQRQLPTGVRVVALARSADAAERAARVGTRCAGAAARLLGVVGRVPLATALATELASVGGSGADEGVLIGLEAYDAMVEHSGCIRESEAPPPGDVAPPEWIAPSLEAPRRAAPIVSRPANSIANPTGLWRTLRPVIDAEKCHRCWWVCGTLCPDNCILIGADARPSIDYLHCKGCLVCAMQCPHRAIDIVPEPRALEVPA